MYKQFYFRHKCGHITFILCISALTIQIKMFNDADLFNYVSRNIDMIGPFSLALLKLYLFLYFEQWTVHWNRQALFSMEKHSTLG